MVELDENNKDEGPASAGDKPASAALDDSPERVRQKLKEVADLPLPPRLANKSRDFFAAIVRRAAKEAASKIPEGEPVSPLVRSALNAGLPTSARRRASRGQIGNSSISNTSLSLGIQ